MQGRMFKPNETEEARRIAEMIAADPEKDWSGFLNSLITKDKLHLLLLAQGILIDLHEKALDNIVTAADGLFMLLQLNIYKELEANPDSKDRSYRDLCESIGKSIADPERKSSLKDSIGSAHIKHYPEEYQFYIGGLDFNREAANKIARATGILDTHLTLCEAEVVVGPPKQ